MPITILPSQYIDSAGRVHDTMLQAEAAEANIRFVAYLKKCYGEDAMFTPENIAEHLTEWYIQRGDLGHVFAV